MDSEDGIVLEVCCGSADFAIAAAAAGADRVELCANLPEGGTTPSLGAVRLAAERCGVPVMAMVRPRGGDFLYSETELEVMLDDIRAFADAGATGVVFGVLRADGTIDRERTARLVDAARPMEVTFHRAFDLSADLGRSLDDLIDLGIDRVLTSAASGSVLDALPRLTALIERASERIVVLPGGGVRPENVGALLAVGGIREVHIGAKTRAPSAMRHRVEDVPMGSPYIPDEYAVEVADVQRIRGVARCLAGVGSGGGAIAERPGEGGT